MRIHKKVALAVAAGVFGTALVGGAALAAIQPVGPAASTTQPDESATQADDRGKPGARLTEVLQKLVDAGTITAAQRDAILAKLKDAAATTNGAKPATPGAKGKAAIHGAHGDLAGAATYLGLTTDQIRTQQKAGKSLAEIATGAGKTRQGLIDALTATAIKRIDDAQKAGKLTADQATKMKTGIAERIGKLVDAKKTR
jgi:hypothetical protein